MDEKGFKLHKVMLDGIGLTCKYIIVQEEGENIVTYDYQQTISRPPHEDLLRHFISLSCAARQMLGMDDKEGRLNAVGLILSGKEGEKASIACEYAAAGGAVKMRTPKCAYQDSDRDYAATMTVEIPAIVAEVYAYLFEGKSAEMGEL